MRRFFCAVLPDEHQPLCVLSAQESRHLFRVVKIAQGEAIELFDGKGTSCVAVLQSTQQERAHLQWQQTLFSPLPDKKCIHLYLSLLKQAAFSTALRMATEIGVHHITPVLAERSVARGEKPERWHKILLAAAKQCGSSQIPILHPMMTSKQILTESDPSNRNPQEMFPHFILSPPSESTFFPRPIPERAALWIGPEGGFSTQELHAAQKNWQCIGWSGSVLRADTAVAAILSLFLLS